MFRANEKTFLKILFSEKDVEVHVYCEDDIVYYWKGLNGGDGNSIACYIMSPKTGIKYNKFVEDIKNSCPLLLELI